MKDDVLQSGDAKQVVRHHRPKHLAERFERYVGIGIVIAGAVLLAVLLYAFMQTGTGTPSWMQ
jgi:hypothetical protein